MTIYALTLPEAGKSLVVDTFRLHKISGAKGGGITLGLDFDYGRVISAAKTSAKSALGASLLSKLAVATGGTHMRLRDADEFDRAVAAIGLELKSLYTLTYYPDFIEPGYHAIQVQVKVPGATTFSRPGYWYTVD